MSAHQFLDPIVLAMTLGAALMCAGLVLRGCLENRAWPTYAIALMAFFVIMLAEAAERLNRLAPSEVQIGWLEGSTLLLVPSLGACIWFYVRGITSSAQRFVRKDLWHAVPILLCILGAMPFLMLPPDRQEAILGTGAGLTDTDLILPIIFLLLAWVSWLAILILYGGACLNRLIKHRRDVRDLYSKLDGVSLHWLHVLILIVVAFFVATIASALLPAADETLAFPPLVVSASYLFVVLCVGMFGVLQKSVVPDWNELALEQSTKQRYARSTLQSDDLARIAKKLDAKMQKDQLWQDPDLSLNDLSAATGVSQHKISQTLNEHLGKNFYDYVNGWRISAACEALEQSDASVLSIALDVGFNAKSTFNAAFKKLTGQTPRQFRNNPEPNAPQR